MKKTNLLMALMLMLTSVLFAQAPLPTSENFTGFTGTFAQAGWTFNNTTGTSYTYATGQVGVAGRMDGTGEYIEVYVGGQMGTVSYYLKGQNSGGGWQGTFKVRESINGSTWTDMVTYSNNIPTAAFTLYTNNPAAASRYIRFEYTTKVSGHNLAIDEIGITAGVPAIQDINVMQGGNSILSGGTTSIFSSSVGVPTNLNLTVQDLGLTNLNVSSVSFTGPASADYSLSTPSLPTTVNATGSTTFTVVFTPSSPGTRAAVMTINSDDPDEAAYIINLYGVGGTLATEPSDQAVNFSTTISKSYRVGASFGAASSNPEGYIVLKKVSGSPITDAPVDGQVYDIGDIIGSSKVLSVGTPTSFSSNAIANNTYQFAIFSYNGNGTFTNYNVVTPLIGSINSSGSMMPGGEYTGITHTSPSFISTLSAHVNNHNFVFYSNYDETMIRLFEAQDTINGQRYVTCAYSGLNQVYTEPFDWTTNDFSREHTFCHSWMPTFPCDNPEQEEYNDQHNLYPTKFTGVNDERSNYPLGEVVTIQNSYLQALSGFDANSHKVFEPRQQHKGNAARAIFYECIAYYTTNTAWHLPSVILNGSGNPIGYTQDQNVLKQWHYADLPDNYDIARNDFLDSLQGNRNPFVDSIDWVCYIDFDNMTLISNPPSPCNTVEVKEYYGVDFDYELFPNPAKSNFSVYLNSEKAENYTITVYDLAGRAIFTQTEFGKIGKSYFYLSNSSLQSGVYLVEVAHNGKRLTKKLIIQ